MDYKKIAIISAGLILGATASLGLNEYLVNKYNQRKQMKEEKKELYQH